MNGTDFSSKPGIVLVDKPIKPLEKVERSTVGQSYTAIVNDLKDALTHFTAAGGDRGDLFYFGEAAVHGLLARTYLYMEEWDDAAAEAQNALDAKGITTLTYGNGYLQGTLQRRCLEHREHVRTGDQLVAELAGPVVRYVWSTYDYSPSPWLQSIYEVRTAAPAFGFFRERRTRRSSTAVNSLTSRRATIRTVPATSSMLPRCS